MNAAELQTSLRTAWPLFSASEKQWLAGLADAPTTIQHQRLCLIVKATRLCNLRCSYCTFWREGPNQVMPLVVLAKATREALSLPQVKQGDFVWHGRGATLL